MGKIPLAVQLYSVGSECARDLPGTLKKIAAMGYEGVEFAGYHKYSAQDLRRMLDDLGLKPAGTHIGLRTLMGDELQKTVEFNATLGNRFLIVPDLPADFKVSLDMWKKAAETLNGIADRVAAHGMMTGYHNHYHEFAPLEGVVPWKLLMEQTKKSVGMQLDTGHAARAKQDVVRLVETHAGRALTLHVKEFSATNNLAIVGEGDVPWARLFRACETVGGTQWYIVEQESHACPPMECIERCLKNLRNLGR